MPQCIYCGREGPVREFNREHVLPRAFGHFQNAPTLTSGRRYRVCRVCNQQLGDQVDVVLARGSIEAALRVMRGLVPPDDLGRLNYDRIAVSLPSGHPLFPMLLRFVPGPDGSGISTSAASQLRLSIENGPLQCIPEHRIGANLPSLLKRGRPSNIGVFWWNGDPAAPKRIQDKATAAGLSNRDWNAIVDESQKQQVQVDVNFDFTIDAPILRAIAKIAFEYFVWAIEPVAAHLIRIDSLRPIRMFILAGDGDSRAFVKPTNASLLRRETTTLRRTQSHILTLDWGYQPGSPVVGGVALFNDLSYHVRISEALSPIWQDIDHGHHFDPSTGRISALAHGRFVQPAW